MAVRIPQVLLDLEDAHNNHPHGSTVTNAVQPQTMHRQTDSTTPAPPTSTFGARKFSDTQIAKRPAGRQSSRSSFCINEMQNHAGGGFANQRSPSRHSMLQLPSNYSLGSTPVPPKPPSVGCLYSFAAGQQPPPAQTPPIDNPLFQLSNRYIRVVGGGDKAVRKLLSKMPAHGSKEEQDSSLKRSLDTNETFEDQQQLLQQQPQVLLDLGVGDVVSEKSSILGATGNKKTNLRWTKGRGKVQAVAPSILPPDKLAAANCLSLNKESATLGQRLKNRKKLFIRRFKLCELCVISAALGLVVMLIESELCAHDYIKKDQLSSQLLKTVILLTTLMLMLLVFLYHWTEVKLSVIDSGAEDWRVAITTTRICKLLLEESLCMLCPIPGTGSIPWPNINSDTCLQCTNPDQTYLKNNIIFHMVPIDVLLSIPMFLRCYLLGRYMVLHSRLFRDAATRSIAALNRVQVDFNFVTKTQMQENPLLVLVGIAVCYWASISWLLTQCERHTVPELSQDHRYLNSLWFVIVTFLTIGYGDVIPNTYCGRALAVLTGIMGAGVSSALIAVISRKLDLTRAEKHVNAFMADSKLTRSRKNAAAAVLQQTWFIYKYRYMLRIKDEMKIRLHQRKFLAAITEFRRVKLEQRKLTEQSHMLIDIAKVQADMSEALWEIQQSHRQLLAQINLLSERVNDVHGCPHSRCCPSCGALNTGRTSSNPTVSGVPSTEPGRKASPSSQITLRGSKGELLNNIRRQRHMGSSQVLRRESSTTTSGRRSGAVSFDCEYIT